MATTKSNQPVVYSRIELNGRKGSQFVGYAEYPDTPPHYAHSGGIMAVWDDESSQTLRAVRSKEKKAKEE